MDIYIINLDRRQDRFDKISSDLASLGLEYIRVAAIDGATINDGQYSIVDKATEACWQSHQKVFASIARGRANNALVLEDDAVLSDDENWRQLLNDLDEYMTRSSIDVLQLGFIEREFPTRMQKLIWKSALAIYSAVQRLRERIIFTVVEEKDHPDNCWNCLKQAPGNLQLVPDTFEGGTHCYMISSRAASVFLNLNIPVALPADDFFTAFADSSADFHRFRFARTTRSLASQRNQLGDKLLDSDIWPQSVSFKASSRRCKQ